LKREELAEKIAPQDWSKLGLCFQSRYNWHRTTADLVARSGLYTPPVDLCKRLIEALANLGVSVAELIAALKHIGLVAIGKNIQDTYHITQKEVDYADWCLFIDPLNNIVPESDQHVNLLILTSPAYTPLIEHKLSLLSFRKGVRSDTLWTCPGGISWHVLIIEFGQNQAATIRQNVPYASEILFFGDCHTKGVNAVGFITEIQRVPPFTIQLTNRRKGVHPSLTLSTKNLDDQLLDALCYVEAALIHRNCVLPIGCVVRPRQTVLDSIFALTSAATTKLLHLLPFNWCKKLCGWAIRGHSEIKKYLEDWIGTTTSYVAKNENIAFKLNNDISPQESKQMVSHLVQCATSSVGANGSVLVFVEVPLYYVWELNTAASKVFQSFAHLGLELQQIYEICLQDLDEAMERKDNEPYLKELKDFRKRMELNGVPNVMSQWLSWEPSAAGEITVTENNRLSITSDCIKCVRIGNKDLQAIQNALKSNTITAVHIKQSRLDDNGVKELAPVLKEHKLVKFSYTQSSRVIELIKVMKGSHPVNSFKELNLQQNNIGDEGARYIAKVLEQNTSLKELNLQQNNIGYHGAYEIAKALEQNTSLTKLNLQQNNIDDYGAHHIVGALEQNTSLKELNLQQNNIGGAFEKKRSLLKLMVAHFVCTVVCLMLTRLFIEPSTARNPATD
jgi:hypothetical protein